MKQSSSHFDPYELGVFRVNDCIPPLAIQADGCIADFVGGTLHINTLVYRPSVTMQSNADVDKNGFRLGVYTYQNAVMLAVKAGKLPWQDAPYTPHLTAAENLPENTPFPNGCGLAACHLLIDSSDGRILQLKSFSLTAHFSNHLINAIYTLKRETFRYPEYAATVARIQKRYSPRELGTAVNQDSFRFLPRR